MGEISTIAIIKMIEDINAGISVDKASEHMNSGDEKKALAYLYMVAINAIIDTKGEVSAKLLSAEEYIILRILQLTPVQGEISPPVLHEFMENNGYRQDGFHWKES